MNNIGIEIYLGTILHRSLGLEIFLSYVFFLQFLSEKNILHVLFGFFHVSLIELDLPFLIWATNCILFQRHAN
jgi:hypothetical protein